MHILASICIIVFPVEDFTLSLFCLLTHRVIANDSVPHLFCSTTARDAYPFNYLRSCPLSDFVSIISTTIFACIIM